MSEDRPPHYPVMLDVIGRLAVIVGGGQSAMRAAASLAKHGADVVVITPDVSTDLMDMEVAGTITIEPRDYVRGDLEGAMLVIAATGSAETNAAIAAEAWDRNALVNVQADATASTFIVPSVVRRGDLQIAVSTAGKAPSVTRQVRRGIARAHGEEWGAYVRLVAELRTLVITRYGLTEAELAPLFRYVTDSDVLTRLHGGEKVDAEAIYRDYLASREDETPDETRIADE